MVKHNLAKSLNDTSSVHFICVRTHTHADIHTRTLSFYPPPQGGQALHTKKGSAPALGRGCKLRDRIADIDKRDIGHVLARACMQESAQEETWSKKNHHQ